MREIYSASDDTLGYEWSEFHVYVDDNGQFRIDAQSGCSCNYYEATPENAKPSTKQEVINEFTLWGSHFNPQNKTRELERLFNSLKSIR
jgi:hypothetical protein